MVKTVTRTFAAWVETRTQTRAHSSRRAINAKRVVSVATPIRVTRTPAAEYAEETKQYGTMWYDTNLRECETIFKPSWDPHRLTTLYTSAACYGYSFTFLYVDDVRTTQETHIWTSTACYGDSFSILYVENVRTSQETRL
jgi:hypothetical protein